MSNYWRAFCFTFLSTSAWHYASRNRDCMASSCCTFSAHFCCIYLEIEVYFCWWRSLCFFYEVTVLCLNSFTALMLLFISFIWQEWHFPGRKIAQIHKNMLVKHKLRGRECGMFTVFCCCSVLPIWQVSIFTNTILICLVPTSLVHHNWYCLPPSSITNPSLPQTFFPCIYPSNVILSNESCMRIWPNHLFCWLLRVLIISFSVSTICNTSSFVLCSVHDTFIIRLHIHI